MRCAFDLADFGGVSIARRIDPDDRPWLYFFSRPATGAAIFALGIALITAAYGYPYLIHGGDLSSWQATDASIVRLEEKRGTGRKGRRSYSVYCDYQYEFNGKTYTGDRLTLFPFNSKSEKRKWFYRLNKARNAGESIVCYVNPDNPTMAVLTTEVTTLQLVLIYGGFGVSAMYLFVWLMYLTPRQQRRRRDKKRNTDDKTIRDGVRLT